MDLLLALVMALGQAVGGATTLDAAGGTATFYCSDGRDGSPESRCTEGFGPDSPVAAIDRKDTPFDKNDQLRVEGPEGSMIVRVVDVCACGGDRIIDLPIGAFEHIAGDWRVGEVGVTIEKLGRGGGPEIKLPATDTE